MGKTVCVIDGACFDTLETFYIHALEALTGTGWESNLDAFNDILRGGFGTPEGGYILRWRNWELSRQRLGYAETVRQLRLRLGQCHPSNVPLVTRQLEDACHGRGPTVFDWLVEIIQVHCPGGEEEEDGVELEFE